MSLPELQKAVALLIRLPQDNRDEKLDSFLTRFDLNVKETDKIKKIAQDRLVAKFGYSMSGVRWETVSKQIKLAHSYLPSTLLETIFQEYFEPSSIHVPQWQLSRSFFDFLLENEDARRALEKEAPPFVFDILCFERAQLIVWWKLREPSPLSPQSRLAHSAFEFVDLNYDILDVLNRTTGEEKTSEEMPVPEKRRVKILILPQESKKECRFFEVDGELQRFLESEAQVPPGKVSRPDDFEMLVSLGLCRG